MSLNKKYTMGGFEMETKLCKYCKTEIPKGAKICANCGKKQGGKLKWVIIAIVLIFLFTPSGGEDSEQAENVNTAEVSGEIEEGSMAREMVESQNDSVAGEMVERQNDSVAKETVEGQKEVVKTEEIFEDPLAFIYGQVKSQEEVAQTEESTVGEDVQETAEIADNEFQVGEVGDFGNMKITYISAQVYNGANHYSPPAEGNVYYKMEFEFENTGDVDETVSIYSFECYADGYSAKLGPTGDDYLSATLSPGKKVRGTVCYEVPLDAEEVILEYETNYWTQNKIIFVVK